MQQETYSIKQLAVYFVKLGATGFGGPVALVGYMHRDLVEKKQWLTEEEYKKGLTLAQLAPGPLAAQMGIYIGYVHHGIAGATVAGLAFVLPSFLMVVILGMLYRLFGGLHWMQAVFYGIGAAVIGIISVSAWRLTSRSVSAFKPALIKQHWLRWSLYLIAAIVTVITQSEQFFLFIGAGLLYMFVKAPPKWMNKNVHTVLIPGLMFFTIPWSNLAKIAWFFTKAGAFVFGSGLAIVPFLHGGVVNEYHWLTEQEFIDAVAVAMITPGPVVITVGFIGYLTAGLSGACIAAIATFLPCYLLTILLAPFFERVVHNLSVRSFVDGITAAVIGSLAGAVVILAERSLVDVFTWGIALLSIMTLLYLKKIQEPLIILLAGIAGLILKP
jgi:chromate transporter